MTTLLNGYCPECEPETAAARVRDLCREHAATPMERDFPTICEWVRYGCVSADRLEAELRRALDLVGGVTDA